MNYGQPQAQENLLFRQVLLRRGILDVAAGLQDCSRLATQQRVELACGDPFGVSIAHDEAAMWPWWRSKLNVKMTRT